ncbi:DMT family transporter [Amaricoccus sp.]|uniref:DMT family transporter n=1 Tax=Amaricoccus sp. TaxID=1872485 RepID=UPI001B76A692|nr:DMT family transporter [Amaricoccus sp.]MBP7001673.1 DMT family transporter [Amaricoccus sp.]
MMHIAAPRRNPLALSRPEAALVAITVVWGATFLVVQLAMLAGGAPLAFVGLRFAAAGLATLALFAGAMRGLTRRELGAGIAVGACIFLGFSLQTVGLQTISSSRSAFITAVYVPLVPILQLVVLRRPPPAMAWAGVALAFVGLVLIAGPQAGGTAGGLALGPGEVATLLGAVAIAAEIILVGRFAGSVDVRRITVVQLLTASGLAFAFSPVAGESLPASAGWVAAALGLGLASAVIQLTINWAQRTVSPTRATLIYAGEPVWGGVVGRLAGDRLPPLALLGGALIVAAVMISEWRPRRRRQPVDNSMYISI